MTKIKFHKYQGCGNDFVIVNEETIKSIKNLQDFIISICNRNFGVGANGLIFPKKINGYYQMNYYNSDGSYAKMCGNGLRCFVTYLNKCNLQIKNNLVLVGEDFINTQIKNNLVYVDMGKYGSIKKLSLQNQELYYTKMHVDHSQIFVKDIPTNFKEIGQKIENDKFFENKTNVNFIKIKDKNNLIVKTWERGSGYTLACGSGVCASCVCYIKQNLHLQEKKINVHVDGGIINVVVKKNKNVIMSGPAQHTFSGVYSYKNI